jgi:hypothetical protein
MEIAVLVLTAIGVAAAIIAALPPLGFDLRIIGRPKMPLEGIPYFRARQAWIAIVIAAISLGVSVTAFYYFFRPRTVEKIGEKPVEKPTPAPCPDQREPTVTPRPGAKPSKSHGPVVRYPITPPKTSDSSQPPQPTINAPNGIGISGGQVTNPTVNNYAPPQRVLDPATSQRFTQSLKDCGQYGIGLRHASGNEESSALAAQFEEAIKAANWTLIRPKFLIQENEGHGIFVLGPKTAEETPAASCLEKALASIGVNITTTKVDDLPETDLYVGLR